MIQKLTEKNLKQATHWLAERDFALARVYGQYGYPPLWARAPGFSTLVHIILEQQVSLASANAAFTRLQERLGAVTAAGFRTLDDDSLRQIGFSRQKTGYARALALEVETGRLDLSRLTHLPDDDVRAVLKQQKGIGDWTADIYLSECLLRPDILPKGDIAMQEAFRVLNGLEKRPAHEVFEAQTQHWRPWRSVGARLLWHFYLSERKRNGTGYEHVSLSSPVMMADFFYHKRIWITGASSGIGEALAYACAGYGAHLILSSRKEAELRRVATAAAEKGAASVFVQPLDLAQHDAIPGIAATVLRQVGKVDILINCGGLSQRGRALDTPLDVDKRLMDINFFGTVALTKAILPSMLTHQLGHIVAVTSLTGKFGSPVRSAYAASKHALHGFFDSLRAELGDTPVKITLACPGFVRTNISINAVTGSGAPQGTMDEATGNGMSAEAAARRILRAIQGGKEEIWFGGKEVLGVYLKRFFPAYFSKIIRKAKVT